jgi:predicted permease
MLDIGRRKRELQEEIDDHLRMAIADRVERGETEETARRAALREFGNVAVVQDLTRETWGWTRLEWLAQDFRCALRQIRRSPWFAATVIGTLALGIGAAAAMFTVVEHVLLRPLPYKDAGRLVVIRETGSRGPGVEDVPWLDIEQWRAQGHSFDGIAFSGEIGGRNYLESNTAASPINGFTVSSNLFDVLGVQPALGSGFLADAPSSTAGRNASTVVLSDAIWKGAFGGDRKVLGKMVRINNVPYTVAGVMPPNFQYPEGSFANRAAQVWIPLQLGDNDKTRGSNAPSYTVVARLRQAVPVERASAEMALIQKRVAMLYDDPEVRKEHSGVLIDTYATTVVGVDVKKALLALLAAAGMLWLIATVNVTNLLLARSTARQREIAMRGALGASRWRIVKQMVVEGLTLSSAAAMLGIGLALSSVKLLAHELSQHLPLPTPATPDYRILAALLGMTVISALLSTAWPAHLAARAPIEPALRQGGLQTGMGRRHHRLRGALVAVQIAMSLMLLVVCGLLQRTIYTLRHVPLGYRTDHIIVANLNIPSFRFAGTNMLETLYVPMLERVRHLHGVQSAGLMNEVPLGDTFNIVLGLSLNGGTVTAIAKPVTPEIQRIFGFKMLAGRYFNAQDSPASQPVVVVNPAFAREYAPDKHDPASVLGKTLWHLEKDKPLHIVGILDDERQKSVTEPSQPEINVCLCQIAPSSLFYRIAEGIGMDLVMRTEQPTAELIPELREILRQATPEFSNATVSTMDQIVEDSYGSQRLAAHLLEIFGGSALLLCVTGLYGLLAYVVTQRTREFGVRIALGAKRAHLLWFVMRQAGVMLLAGVAVGTGLALASGRLVRGFLYGVNAHDGLTIAGSAVLLLACGFLAAYLPACRAAGVNPMEALRAE